MSKQEYNSLWGTQENNHIAQLSVKVGIDEIHVSTCSVWMIWFQKSGFQAGPTFPAFPYFFLKMPYYHYFLVQKCLKWPKIVMFFLACFARLEFVKIRAQLFKALLA